MKIPLILTRAPRLRLAAVLTLAGAALISGCGGGGNGGGGSNPTPRPTVAPIPPTQTTLIVQLRDAAGAPVDGIVTLGAQRRATTNGNVTFNNVTNGSQTVSVEVNGQSFSRTVIATLGTSTFPITVPANITPTPAGTPPAPPPL